MGSSKKKIVATGSKWEPVCLGDVTNHLQDLERQAASAGFDRFLKVEHFDSERLTIPRWGEIADGDLPPTFYKIFRKGQVLYPTRNPHLRRTGRADFDGICGEKTLTLETNGQIDARLLPLVFQTEAFVEYATSMAIGSTNPHVRWRDIAAYRFHLPPKGQQEAIADVLLACDLTIECYIVAYEKALRLLRVNMVHALSKGVHATGAGPAGNGKLPTSWRIESFDDICTRLTYGFTNPMPSSETGPWMVTATNILDGKIDYASTRHTTPDAYDELLTDKSRPRVGDVLITKDGTLGRVAVVDRDDICINQSVALLQPDHERVTSEFLALSLRNPVMQRKLLGDAGGSTIKHIYITKLAKTPVGVPPRDEQEAIVDTISVVEDNVMKIEKHLQHCRRLKSMLVNKLFSEREE